MKFGPVILMRIAKIVAIKCQILRLKCTKSDFGCGSAPDPAVGAYIFTVYIYIYTVYAVSSVLRPAFVAVLFFAGNSWTSRHCQRVVG